jgi:methyl-accepting chemotaxis protein
MTGTNTAAADRFTSRRRYLIDPKRQLRTALMTSSVVALLMLVINVGFAVLRSSQTSFLSAVAPQLTPVLHEQDTVFTLVMALLSIGLVALVSVKTILETHRTAGAVFAVRQRLDRVRQGDYQVTLRLRRNDNLQDLENPFNEMVAALRRRALEDADRLEEIARKAASLDGGGDEISATLIRLARDKRDLGS